MRKVAQTSQDATKLEESYEGKPHGWIQWKGTDVCMDIYCKCGHHSHIDADFAYSVECPACGTCYHCNPHVELIELTERPTNCLKRGEE